MSIRSREYTVIHDYVYGMRHIKRQSYAKVHTTLGRKMSYNYKSWVWRMTLSLICLGLLCSGCCSRKVLHSDDDGTACARWYMLRKVQRDCRCLFISESPPTSPRVFLSSDILYPLTASFFPCIAAWALIGPWLGFLWLALDWPLIGILISCGWPLIGPLLAFYFPVVGPWLAPYWPLIRS